MPPPLGDQVLSKPPKLSEDERIDALLKTKLHLEASLEANRVLTLPTLDPEHMATLLPNSLQQSTDYNQRTLLYYTEMDKALESKLRGMDESISRCRQIEEKLLEDNEPDSEEGELATVFNRFRSCKKMFQEFKTVFRAYMDHIAEKHSDMNIADVLQALTDKLMDNPHDPYMDMAELECDDKTFNFLLRYNLVQRHSEDPRKMKLLDPRTN